MRWNKSACWFVECQDCGWRGNSKGALCETCDSSNTKPARRRVFCASLADWLDKEVPIEWLADLLNLIRITPNLDWLLLSKRIGNFHHRISHAQMNMDQYSIGNRLDLFDWLSNWAGAKLPENIWLGATVCNQIEADRDIPKLLAAPAKIRFLSCEPLLGIIDLTLIEVTQSPGYFGDYLQWYHRPHEERATRWNGIDWVICGGESGPGARPMHPHWVRSLRDQCVSSKTPFFFKQWGEWLAGELIPGKTTYARCDTGEVMKSNGRSTRDNFMTHPDKHSGNLIALKIGKKNSGRLLDGIEWNQFPRTVI